MTEEIRIDRKSTGGKDKRAREESERKGTYLSGDLK